MAYTHENIIWIKHVTNPFGGTAYMDVDDKFELHLPNKHRKNLLQPKVGDLIVLYQKVNGKSCFTHIVTPIDSIELPSNREQYAYGRNVVAIARTEINNAILRGQVGWDKIKFPGISQGNFCEIDHIKSIASVEQLNLLKTRLWNAFEPFINAENIEFISNILLAQNEIDSEKEGMSVTEGGRKLVVHLARERNQRIVREKKQQALKDGTLFCEVCNFSFKKVFGIDFIECHHRIPISSGEERITNLDDLALVCANCHRMLHNEFDRVYLTVEDMKAKFY